jgi:carbon storage regulator
MNEFPLSSRARNTSRTKEWIMLVLSRKKDEKIIIGDNITLMVVDIQGDKVRLGIEAPRELTVHREEVYQSIQKKQHEPEHANS